MRNAFDCPIGTILRNIPTGNLLQKTVCGWREVKPDKRGKLKWTTDYPDPDIQIQRFIDAGVMEPYQPAPDTAPTGKGDDDAT